MTFRFRDLVLGSNSDIIWETLSKQDFEEVHSFSNGVKSKFENYIQNFLVQTLASVNWVPVIAENGNDTAADRQV